MTKSTLRINQYGTLIWLNEKGQFHREDDKPAIIYSDGSKRWYVNGRLIKVNDD